MEEITYKSILCYDEFLPLEVASFGDGAATKVQFDERMQGPYWTAREGGTLAGFMNAAVREDCLHIMHLEVAPAFRRRGIARRLLHTACAFAGDAGVSRLMLRVRADNAPARALYIMFGFHETGRRQCRFACPVERLAVETAVRVEKGGDGYRYPVRFTRSGGEIGGGQFNEEVSGIKDLFLDDPDALLLPALSALRSCLKPGCQILYVMMDDDLMIQSCMDKRLILQSTILDMEYILVKHSKCQWSV